MYYITIDRWLFSLACVCVWSRNFFIIIIIIFFFSLVLMFVHEDLPIKTHVANQNAWGCS